MKPLQNIRESLRHALVGTGPRNEYQQQSEAFEAVDSALKDLQPHLIRSDLPERISVPLTETYKTILDCWNSSSSFKESHQTFNYSHLLETFVTKLNEVPSDTETCQRLYCLTGRNWVQKEGGYQLLEEHPFFKRAVCLRVDTNNEPSSFFYQISGTSVLYKKKQPENLPPSTTFEYLRFQSKNYTSLEEAALDMLQEVEQIVSGFVEQTLLGACAESVEESVTRFGPYHKAPKASSVGPNTLRIENGPFYTPGWVHEDPETGLTYKVWANPLRLMPTLQGEVWEKELTAREGFTITPFSSGYVWTARTPWEVKRGFALTKEEALSFLGS